MDNQRQVIMEVTGSATQDGAGVQLVRVLGNQTAKAFDPFLMLDAFDSMNPDNYIKGFPWHPHRGIETVTYLISGEIEHGDSMGNAGSITDGGCQWMTAGSGVIHQEMPKASSRMLGAQLWINLPAANKMVPPAYNGISASDVPNINENGALIKVVSGSYKGTNGAFSGKFVDATYLDVTLDPNTEWAYESVPEDTLFVYIYSGGGYFQKPYETHYLLKRALLLSHGHSVNIKAGEDGLGFLLLTAKPLNEPIAWGGPIVMNTREELNQAFRELDDNTFVK